MNAQIIDLAQLLRDRDIAHYGGASMESVAQANALIAEAERVLETPAQTVARLLAEAEALDARSDAAVLEGAQYADKAAVRRRQGETDLAAQFQRMADARDKLAAQYVDDATRLRLRACRIQCEIDIRADIREIANGFGGDAA